MRVAPLAQLPWSGRCTYLGVSPLHVGEGAENVVGPAFVRGPADDVGEVRPSCSLFRKNYLLTTNWVAAPPRA
jgi:hypothetical protein